MKVVLMVRIQRGLPSIHKSGYKSHSIAGKIAKRGRIIPALADNPPVDFHRITQIYKGFSIQTNSKRKISKFN